MYNRSSYNLARYNVPLSAETTSSSSPPSPPAELLTPLAMTRAAYNRAYANYLEVLSSPRPNYSIDGQSVSWGDYLKVLQEQLERLRQQLVLLGDPQFMPMEIRTRGI